MINHHKNTFLPRIHVQASEEEVEHSAQLLFQQIEGQLIFSEIKAYLAISADTFLVILLALTELPHLHTFFHGSTSLLQHLITLCFSLMLLALLGSGFYAVRAILPSLHDRNRITLMYFGHIAELQQEKFITNFQNQPVRELKESLLSEIYAKARIVRRRLSLVSWSIVLFFASLLLWIATQLLQQL